MVLNQEESVAKENKRSKIKNNTRWFWKFFLRNWFYTAYNFFKILYSSLKIVNRIFTVCNEFIKESTPNKLDKVTRAYELITLNNP